VRSPSTPNYCSAICKAKNCNGKTYTDCTGCYTGWDLTGGTCQLRSDSGYVVVGLSPYVGGSNITYTANSGSCGGYSF
jgi:hypothetical protein